jgi:hypothetical protein
MQNTVHASTVMKITLSFDIYTVPGCHGALSHLSTNLVFLHTELQPISSLSLCFTFCLCLSHAIGFLLSIFHFHYYFGNLSPSILITYPKPQSIFLLLSSHHISVFPSIIFLSNAYNNIISEDG